MGKWKPIGESYVDFEPTELADSFLDELMTRSKNRRNFITYVAGHERDAQQYRVRVNCKFNPEDSYVKMPTAMEGYAKTTMIKIRGEPHWKIYEDRIYAKQGKEVEERNLEYMCIFYNPKGLQKMVSYFMQILRNTTLAP